VVEALQDAALTDERDGTALLNPGHVLAAADADRATFDADRGGAKLEEMSGIAVAVVDVVQSPGPSPRSIRHQTIKNRDADKRAAALRRVRIVLVCPRPAGLRIDRGSRGGDSRAHGATARSDLHVGAVLRRQRPLGSADADPAQNSAQSVTAAAAQSLGSSAMIARWLSHAQ